MFAGTLSLSIPTFYDEDWNTIWSSSNGTNASALAGNLDKTNRELEALAERLIEVGNIDNMPYSVMNSTVLTGNDLGKLGVVEALPQKDEINLFKDTHKEFNGLTEKELHSLASVKLDENSVDEAWKILLYNFYP